MWAAIFLIGHINNPVLITVYVPTVEWNHYYDSEGQHVFDQLIGWEQDTSGTPVVAWWKFVKRYKNHAIYHENARRWSLSIDGTHRIVAEVFFETWTQYDPEVANQKIWPRDLRRGFLEFPEGGR